MSKLVLATSLVAVVALGACAKHHKSEPVYAEPIAAPVYVEPVATKKY